MPATIDRPDFFPFRNGEKVPLPFTRTEYQNRLKQLRETMALWGIDAVLFTSMHNIAYYSGFLYCSFGRPYACVVTDKDCVTISANIDGGQPWRRSFSDNVVYTDWRRDNFWRAVQSVIGNRNQVGYEADHLSVSQHCAMQAFFPKAGFVDVASDVMQHRLVKSQEEIALITESARIADAGGYAIRDAVRGGIREVDLARVGREAIDEQIAQSFPASEIRDSWVWFQSGLNTDGAHNPVTNRALEAGDILSLNTFPMISGYYTALERTLFLGEPDPASLRIWEANIGALQLGLSLIAPGAVCSDICARINAYFAERELLQYRSFGYGHSFGLLSHYYGREAGLELREDVDTVLVPGMVVSIEPMLTIPQATDGAGGYREHDIMVVTESGATNITNFPVGPENNIVAVSL